MHIYAHCSVIARIWQYLICLMTRMDLEVGYIYTMACGSQTLDRN